MKKKEESEIERDGKGGREELEREKYRMETEQAESNESRRNRKVEIYNAVG